MSQPHRQKSVPLRSISLSLNDIKRIYSKLHSCVDDEANLHLGRVHKPADKTDAEFQQMLRKLREDAFKVEVLVTAPDGGRLRGDDISIFDSPNLPDTISSIYFTNKTAFQNVAQVPPPNSFDLNFDFSKPPLLDPQNPLSTPTPNFSALQVNGDRDAWIAAVTDAVTGVTDNRKNRRKPIHGAFVYDIGLLMIAVPCILYVCWKLSGLVSTYFSPISAFVSTITYVYISMVVLFGYRILFGYTKWAFPSVELKENKDSATKHRAIWFIVIMAVLGNFIYEVLKVIWW